MGDLERDTAVRGADGRYEAELCADWEIWGPNGGYLAAVALRAVGAHSAHRRPASLVCHFLGVARFAKVGIEVETIRSSRRAESVTVRITQDGNPVLAAMVWTVDEDLEGLEHEASPAPGVPRPEDLRSTEERLAETSAGAEAGAAAREGAGAGARPRHAFFRNFDERPVDWIEDWESRPAGEPLIRSWYRFRPVACFDDEWLDAGRLLITVDTFQWPAAVRGHAGGTLRHIAPSLDLSCLFHRMERARRAQWLLVEARSPVAAEGLVGGTASVWDEHGALLASGCQQMLCRPAPGGSAD